MAVTIPFRELSFSGHESFALRYVWLKKGFDALLEETEFFSRDDAMVVLGTGKNMVRAVRHWGLACGVWEEVAQTRGRSLVPTRMGREFFGDPAKGGWDPYLEDAGTIWWLHWRLVTSLDRATTWTWAFGRPKGNVFSKTELQAELTDLIADSGAKKTSPASMKRDIDVFVRSYFVDRAPSAVFIEDLLDSPFCALGLVRKGTERGTLELVQGAKPTLPLAVFEAALVEFCERCKEGGATSIPFEDLLYAPLSPGLVFRLGENDLEERLVALRNQSPDVYLFDETAGLRQLLIAKSPGSSLEILRQHYEVAQAEVAK